MLDDGGRAEPADGKAGLKQRQADLIRLLQRNANQAARDTLGPI